MKSPDNIPGWVIVEEDGTPGLWFRTRDEARRVAHESGLDPKQVRREVE